MGNASGDDGLNITTRTEGDAVVLETAGEVTVGTSPALREALRRAAAEKPARIVIDLSGTGYVDSSGVATLVEGLKLAQQAGGRLVLAGMNERVRGVFEIARLDTVFEMAESVQEALDR